MSVTVANIITNTNTYIGDTSNDRISEAERFQAITEATAWLLEELGNDHAVKTYELDYFDSINYYKVTTPVGDLLASADLRRTRLNQTHSALHKSSRDMAEEIGQGSSVFCWGIDRKNNDTYLVVNLQSTDSLKRAKVIADFDSTTAGGGEWEAGSDTTNITADIREKKYGGASLNFDVDVSLSGDNRATVVNDSLNNLDLSGYEDLGSFLFETYLPDTTDFTSITLYWGSDASNYWSATVSTDIGGSAFADGWNTVKVNWADATSTGTPDETAIDYIRFDFNYTADQTDDTDFRLDHLRIANPEKLTYHYVSWDVGTTSGGTAIQAFTATSDIPFFSGKYDQYKYPVAHKAAAVLFYSMRLREDAQFEERDAKRILDRQRNIFPSSKSEESHNFKVHGINFARRGRRRG